MAKRPNQLNFKMRIIHRYLGFFLAGIMAVYALSGIVLIFRDSDVFKRIDTINKKIDANAAPEELGELLDIRRLEVESTDGEMIYFNNGSYNSTTGEAEYTVTKLPTILETMTHFHKAKSGDPLYFFNIFFGLALLFFVISAFWMFMPQTAVFKKGIYFTLGGIVLTLLLLFV